MSNIVSNIPKSIEDLLEKKECLIIKKAANKWSEGNSCVTSSPIVDIRKVFSAADKIETAVNFVEIKGRNEEPLHFHTAHLVGVITGGEGYLLTASDDKTTFIKKQTMSAGDVIVIPQGAFHYFQPFTEDGELDYIALEFSDKEIDYQKHHSP